MIQFVALAAALFGGGYIAKKALDKRHATVHPSFTTKPVDEFLELRSDGLYQFNRQTAIELLGWLGSVELHDRADGLYDLVSNADGSPPASGSVAAKLLLELCKKGKTILLSRDISIVGKPDRLAAAVATPEEVLRLGSKDGKLAILMVPVEEHVEPTLPAMPGFEDGKNEGVPGGETPEIVADRGDLPNDIRRQIDELLKKHDADDALLEAVARQLRNGGYERSAEMVEARRADIVATELVASPQKFFVIPDGHAGAKELAKRLVGDGARAKELVSLNPALAPNADGTVTPWTPGQIVRLPPSWIT